MSEKLLYISVSVLWILLWKSWLQNS